MLIAHDLGTSGNKASLHDDTGAPVASATETYSTRFAADGTAEQDPQDWWRAVRDATAQLIATATVSPDQIDAVCLSGQMMGAVCLDADHQPTRPAIIWADQRPVAEAAQLTEAVGADQIFRLTGHRMAPTYSLPKFMWIRDHDPDAWQRTRHVCVAKDYVNLVMTGTLVTDHTDASHTDAYDLLEGRWSPTLLGAAEMDEALFPPIVNSTDVVGTLRPEAAEAMGLKPGTAVIAGGGDGLMATVGAGCVSPDRPGYVSLGTSAWFAKAGDQPHYDPEQRSFNFRHAVPGQFVCTATSQNGADALNWVAQTVGLADASAVVTEAATGRAAADDLYFLPYLLGERSPWWSANARGTFIGLQRHHTRADLARAALEGVGFNLALCIESVLGQPATEPVDVIGGGAAGDVWLQILADCWGVPVRRRTISAGATSLGAAVTGLVGLGRAGFDIAPTLSQVEREVPPSAEREMMMQRRLRFEDAYRSLEPWFGARPRKEQP